MILSKIDEKSFLLSSLTLNGKFQGISELEPWLHAREVKNNFSVNEVPFRDMDQWDFDTVSGNIVHVSKKFYSIEGIKVKTNFGNTPEWEQAIINQPEIGILGIITKKFEGVAYFLMQAKMEPGNINISQFSPTVQATKSNYTQIHKGRRPLFLEYFLEKGKARVIVDQLQSEQGGAFLRKRNRNMIVEVLECIELPEDFCWLTLGQIKQLAAVNDLINMDARSVLSCIQYMDDDLRSKIVNDIYDFRFENNISAYGKKLLISMAHNNYAEHSMLDVLAWLTEQKVKYQCEVTSVGLNELVGWSRTEYEIKGSDNCFHINAVKVKAGNREVNSWDQPLVKNLKIGSVGFITQKRNNILHFVVQAKVEPGFIDMVELSPTVSASSACVEDENIPYMNYFQDEVKDNMNLSVILSEEGGRFYKLRNRYMIMELIESEEVELFDNYIWMTLGQILELIKHSGYVSVEMRSLISVMKLL